MDLIVEQWPISRLREYANNPRQNDAHVPAMVAAISEFGFRIPIVAQSDGLVVDGHLRLKAARQMGLATVPVALAEGLSEAQIKAFRIWANKSASLASWDDGLLRLELETLQGLNYELGLTGFTFSEIAGLNANKGVEGVDPEDVPETPQEPVSRLGDVWLLGSHRLVCGDCTSPPVVSAALSGAKPHLMVTDPPYGVEYDAGWRNKAMPAKNDPKRWTDSAGRATGAVMNDERADWSAAWMLFPGDVAYVWHAGNMAHIVAESLLQTGFSIRSQIIWSKSQFVIGRGHYHPHHEPLWYAVRKGGTGHWVGGRKQTTVWNIDKPQKSDTGHSTQKPIECMKRPIENNSNPGDSVYEPFAGSGTTLIAGEMTGRTIFAIEMNPIYIDVSVIRWQNFSGKTARLESTGQTMEEVKASRLSDGFAMSLTPIAKPTKKRGGSSRLTSGTTPNGPA